MTKVAFPYVSYRTFRNFLELLKEGLPSRIDRSVWGPRYSGTTGQQLMTALKSLRLISDNGVPTQKLEELVNSTGTQRQLKIKDILELKYFASIFLHQFQYVYDHLFFHYLHVFFYNFLQTYQYVHI